MIDYAHSIYLRTPPGVPTKLSRAGSSLENRTFTTASRAISSASLSKVSWRSSTRRPRVTAASG